MRELLYVFPLGNIHISVYSDDDLIRTTDCEGLFLPDPDGYKIILDGNLEPELWGQVFVHEVLEAACTLGEIDLPHNQLQTLAVLLAQAFAITGDFTEDDEVEVDGPLN